MNIDRITISIGRTINIGNFNNIKIEASASATTEGDNEPETIADRLIARCTKDLQSAYRAAKEQEYRP